MHSSFHTRQVSNLAYACLAACMAEAGFSHKLLNLAPSLSHIMHLIEIKNTNFETQKVSES